MVYLPTRDDIPAFVSVHFHWSLIFGRRFLFYGGVGGSVLASAECVNRLVWHSASDVSSLDCHVHVDISELTVILIAIIVDITTMNSQYMYLLYHH